MRKIREIFKDQKPTIGLDPGVYELLRNAHKAVRAVTWRVYSEQPSSGDLRRTRGPILTKEMGAQVNHQVAAPAETNTPHLHRAMIAQQRVRTEGWRQRRPG